MNRPAFISPTKTPEYLAAGKPVISTSIRDVVKSYGEPGSSVLRMIGVISERWKTAWSRSVARLRKVDALLRPAVVGQNMEPHAQLLEPISTPWAFRPRRHEAAMYDYLIVGAGFAGAVAAERLAADSVSAS